MPPLEGPRATLWVTRKPVKTRTEPSSIVVGIETSTVFLHSLSTPTRSSAIPNRSATLRSWLWAIRNGLSGVGFASDNGAVASRDLLYPEGDLRPRERVPEHRPGDEAQLVVAGGEHGAARAAPGERERVVAGEEIDDAREHAEEGAVAAVE